MFPLFTLICITIFNAEYVDGCEIEDKRAILINRTSSEVLPHVKQHIQGPKGHPLKDTSKEPRGTLGRGVRKLLKHAYHKIGHIMKKTKALLRETKLLIESVLKHTQNSKTLILMGSSLITAPKHFLDSMVNKTWAVKTFGEGFTNQIVKDTAEWFKFSWDAIQVLSAPGKKLLVMLFPNFVESVVNKATKDIMYFFHKVYRKELPGTSFALFMSLKRLDQGVQEAIKSTGGKCMSLQFPPYKIPLGSKGLDAIYTIGCQLCGLHNLELTRKVNVRKNDQTSLIIDTYWTWKDVPLRLTGVNVVTKYETIGTLAEDESLIVNIDQVDVIGTISFEAGTLLKFDSITLRVDKMERLTVHFPQVEKSTWMRSVKGIAESFKNITMDKINEVFVRISQTLDNIESIG